MTLRITIGLLLLMLTAVPALACASGSAQETPSDGDLRSEVVSALDSLAAELAAERPADAAAYTELLQSYLESNPAFYGSAIALLDRNGKVTASPYVYRTAEGYAATDLAAPSYNIDAQAWVAAPLAANAGVWTEPYFDAGGGEIWMITRSVPVRDGESIFAIVTTDLPVDEPNG